jgi:uncharacterized glyoxalase superfamily protein PhnB
VLQRRRAGSLLRDRLRTAARAPSGRFRGFTLTIHCEDEETVDRAHREVAGFDDVSDLDAEPTRSGWGYGFGFRDPEGNVWGVAFKYGSEFDQHGGFIYP